MRTSNYSVSQPVLYTGARLMWTSCKTNIAAMTAFRGIYSDEYCDERIAEIAAAEALPNDAARSQAHEEKRVTMVSLSATCLSRWRYLKAYIRNSYEPELREIMYNSAGWADYDFASHQNWTSLLNLMKQGLEFITANTVALSNGGTNMPAGFPASFASAKSDFELIYLQFLTDRQDAETATAQKIEANNAIYTKTIEMGLDGQECFYNNDELRKQFVWDSVTQLVAPGGASGMVITVTNAETNQPMLAEVVDITTDRSVNTDSDGRAEMLNLSAGDTSFMIIADGFVQQIIPYTLKTSTTSHLTVRMVPMFSSVGSGENGAGNVTQPAAGSGQPSVMNS